MPHYPLKCPIVGYTSFEEARDHPIVARAYRRGRRRGYANPWLGLQAQVRKRTGRDFEGRGWLYHPLDFLIESRGFPPACSLCPESSDHRFTIADLPDRYDSDWRPHPAKLLCDKHARAMNRMIVDVEPDDLLLLLSAQELKQRTKRSYA